MSGKGIPDGVSGRQGGDHHGRGGGIGRAHAVLLAREGARIAVNDVGCTRDGSGQGDAAARVVEELCAVGGAAVANTDAVGTVASAGRIVQATRDAFGRLDILVNNAGILRDRTLLNMTEEEAPVLPGGVSGAASVG